VRDPDRYEPIEAPGALDVRPVRIDLSSRESIEASCAELGDAVDAIDLLVNNAGAFTAGQLETQDLGDIYDVVQATLLGTVHLTRRVLPGMLARDRGKIVNNSSIVGYLHFPGVSTYSAAKAGVSGFTECLRRELHDTGVSTLHVVTGGIDTDMLEETRQQLAPHYSNTDSWAQHTPEEWAEKIVDAIVDDTDTLGPGGKAALGKLASHLPSFVLDGVASSAFERS